jgi:dTDP-glucose 4,6-dehydratase
MKIHIVTGCAGFIGAAFTERLLKEGYYVYGIDKLTPVANKKAIEYLQKRFPETFKFIEQDIVELTWLPEADAIFNFAAESDVDASNLNDKHFVLSNILGVQNLLNVINNRVVIKTDKPLFVQISTDEVYGDIKKGYFCENSSLNPSNPYAATKASADLLIQSWHRTHELDYMIIRPSNNYGYNQYPEKLIPLAVKRLLRGKKIKLHNNGTPIRTWTHVDDTINGILIAYNLGAKNTIYNISSGFEQTNIDTVKQILNAFFEQTVYNIEDYIDTTYSRAGQDIRYAIQCDRLKQLGWFSRKCFKTELPLLVQEYKRELRW